MIFSFDLICSPITCHTTRILYKRSYIFNLWQQYAFPKCKFLFAYARQRTEGTKLFVRDTTLLLQENCIMRSDDKGWIKHSYCHFISLCCLEFFLCVKWKLKYFNRMVHNNDFIFIYMSTIIFLFSFLSIFFSSEKKPRKFLLQILQEGK